MEKVYLIIAASSEVGLSFIEKLDQSLNEKVTVVAHYASSKEKLELLAKQLQNIDLLMVQADLSEADAYQKILDFLSEKILEPTHVLHLAASKFSYNKINKWDEKKAEREMQIEFFSFCSLMKEILPKMGKKAYGRVCVMLSSYVLGRPPKFMADYVAVKMALYGYVKAAAAEYGEKGVRINGISPNMMETKFLENLNEKIVEMTAESSSLKRNISVEETVKGILYLLSEDASYMNGVNLNLSGGDYMD